MALSLIALLQFNVNDSLSLGDINAIYLDLHFLHLLITMEGISVNCRGR